jgi:hypothetical protein
VPAAKRLRTDQEARAALGRKQTTGRSQQGAITRRVLGPLAAAPEDRELAAQHDDLEFPLAGTADEHAEKKSSSRYSSDINTMRSLNAPAPHQHAPSQQKQVFYPTLLTLLGRT